MHGFSADAFRAAQRPWTVTCNGRTHVARPVSAMQVSEFLARARADRTDRGYFRAMEWLLRLMFPVRISYWWLGDPVRELLSLPREGLEEAMRDFFEAAGLRPQRPTLSSTA